LSSRSDTVVFAGVRDPSTATELSKLAASSTAKIHIIPAAAGNVEHAKAAAVAIEQVGVGLDYFIANAGISQHYGPAAVTDIGQVQDPPRDKQGRCNLIRAVTWICGHRGKCLLAPSLTSVDGSVWGKSVWC
jgi:hypothetical protein